MKEGPFVPKRVSPASPVHRHTVHGTSVYSSFLSNPRRLGIPKPSDYLFSRKKRETPISNVQPSANGVATTQDTTSNSTRPSGAADTVVSSVRGSGGSTPQRLAAVSRFRPFRSNAGGGGTPATPASVSGSPRKCTLPAPPRTGQTPITPLPSRHAVTPPPACTTSATAVAAEETPQRRFQPSERVSPSTQDGRGRYYNNEVNSTTRTRRRSSAAGSTSPGRPTLTPLCTRCAKTAAATAYAGADSNIASPSIPRASGPHPTGVPSSVKVTREASDNGPVGAAGISPPTGVVPPQPLLAVGDSPATSPSDQQSTVAAATPGVPQPNIMKPPVAPSAPPSGSSGKYIIASRSFTEASTQLSAETMSRAAQHNEALNASLEKQRRSSLHLSGSPGGGGGTSLKPLFHRSSIVKQEILLGTSSLKDYYDVNIKSLGKGSYGSVVAARDLQTGATRAVKTVYKPKIENITRLKREILIMKRLDHPNIIRLFEVFEDEKDLYLVMELCTGGELFDRIIKSGHFSERYAASIMKQILSAIAYCHANDVMHRDLKPENVLYSDPSPLSALKVIDWGFAAKCTKNHKFSSVVGTPYYVAPEVLFGNYDRQCDLWSAGVILYILLSGYPPFYGKDNKEILRKVKIGEFSFETKYWGKISDQAKNMIRGLLMFEPRKRLTAAEALQHPWLQYYTQAGLTQECPLTNKLGGDLLEKFRNFQRHNKLKKLALTVVAYQMTERDIGKLHEIFSALDKNHDGVLSIAEVSSGLAHMNVKYGDEIIEILQELDTDGNGTIDYTEFIAASIDHKLYEQEAVCKAAFRVFDLDGDGKITIDEMRKVLEMNFVQEAFTSEMIEDMVKEVDTNNDGSIDFEEFMKMMRGSQKKKLDSSPFSKARALLYRKLE